MSPVAAADSLAGQPAWEVAYLFPSQGQWSEDEFLALHTNRLVELSDGRLEVLPMPTEQHQTILLFLYEVVRQFVEPRKLGKVLVAPLRVRLWKGKIREPDLIFMLAANKHRRSNQVWNGADLVMEVVSEDDPDRDLKIKRAEYAKAGIAEYWVVDPRKETISVFVLGKGKTTYTMRGTYGRGQHAVSVLLRGLKVSATEVFTQE
jgi:Uma2 family endonuclease